MRKLVGLIAAAGVVTLVGCAPTDVGITSSVKGKLAVDQTVKAYQVDVTTVDHVVTLSGDVNSSAARARAIEIASTTEGVRDVIDQLRVTDATATSGISTPDADLRIDVKDDTAESAAAARRDARRAGDAVVDRTKEGAAAVRDGAKEGAAAVRDGAKKGAEAVKDGAKAIGRGVKNAVTDDDRDSDNDGK